MRNQKEEDIWKGRGPKAIRTIPPLKTKGTGSDHLSIVRQGITCAAPASRLFHQNTTLHQIINIPQGGILRTFGQFGPFGRSQLAFKTVEQPVDDGSLAFIEWLVGMSLPEMGFMEDAGQDMFRAVTARGSD